MSICCVVSIPSPFNVKPKLKHNVSYGAARLMESSRPLEAANESELVKVKSTSKGRPFWGANDFAVNGSGSEKLNQSGYGSPLQSCGGITIVTELSHKVL